MLVQESEFIVTARVRAADAETKARVLSAENEWMGGYEVVVLEIDGLVKNDPGRTTIEQVNYLLICPAPARYVVGTRVLAFLDRREKGDGFETHALSYGAKTLDEEGLAVYLERIREQLAIEELPEDESRLARQVEWLVKCAEHPVTCWEGAYELARRGDFMSSYDRRGRHPDFARRLGSGQRDRLRDAFLRAQEFESGEQCLEELLRDDPDPRLLEWLVAELRAHHAEVEEESYCTSASLIERIGRRDPRGEVRRLAAEFKARQEYGELGGDGACRLHIARQILALF
jgi:hypothetical protein